MEAGAMNADDGQWTQLVRALKEPSGTMFAACPDMVLNWLDRHPGITDIHLLEAMLAVHAPGYLAVDDLTGAVRRVLLDSLDFATQMDMDRLATDERMGPVLWYLAATPPPIEPESESESQQEGLSMQDSESEESGTEMPLHVAIERARVSTSSHSFGNVSEDDVSRFKLMTPAERLPSLAFRALFAVSFAGTGASMSSAVHAVVRQAVQHPNLPGSLAVSTLLPMSVVDPRKCIEMSEEHGKARQAMLLPAQRVLAPPLIGFALWLVRRAGLGARIRLCKELAALAMASRDNAVNIMKHADWRRTLLALLVDTRDRQLVRMAANTFGALVQRVFFEPVLSDKADGEKSSKGPQVDERLDATRLVSDMLREVRVIGRGTPESRYVATMFLLGFLRQVRQQHRSFDHSQMSSNTPGPWASLISVFDVIRRFLFHTASWGAPERAHTRSGISAACVVTATADLEQDMIAQFVEELPPTDLHTNVFVSLSGGATSARSGQEATRTTSLDETEESEGPLRAWRRQASDPEKQCRARRAFLPQPDMQSNARSSSFFHARDVGVHWPPQGTTSGPSDISLAELCSKLAGTMRVDFSSTAGQSKEVRQYLKRLQRRTNFFRDAVRLLANLQKAHSIESFNFREEASLVSAFSTPDCSSSARTKVLKKLAKTLRKNYLPEVLTEEEMQV